MPDAHNQAVTHRYVIHYPEHPARQDDPHYRDFEHYRKTHVGTAVCAMGASRGDFSECQGGLELHHAHVEFALQNGIELKWLERVYPGISSPDEIGAWIEGGHNGENLVFYCVFHHRGAGGVHVASSADFEAEKFVRGLLASA